MSAEKKFSGETMLSLLVLSSFISITQAQQNPIREEQWELIGSRTYEWHGSDVLRCRHWDKVAVRWHLSSCNKQKGRKPACSGGANEDFATTSQNYTELPRWNNAFTYVQLPSEEKPHEQFLKLAMEGYDKKLLKLRTISPLKIDVDWRWTIDRAGCNHFTVRMSALSTLASDRMKQLEEFCRGFDQDAFVRCDNL